MRKIKNFLISAGFMAFLAIVGFGLAIYVGFFYEKQGRLTIDVAEPTKILDIHQSVGGLSVAYNGQDLRENNKNLWFVSVVIQNTGNAVIRKDDFDNNALISFKVLNGNVVDKPSIISKDNYFLKNLIPYIQGNSVVLPPLIMNSGESFSIGFFVLGDEAKSPALSVDGKIAGSDGIRLQKIESNSRGWLETALSADKPWDHVIRLFVYFIIGLILFIFIIVIITNASSWAGKLKKKKEKQHRRKQIEKYKPDQSLSLEARKVIGVYLDFEPIQFRKVKACLDLAKKRDAIFDKFEPICHAPLANVISENSISLPYFLNGTYRKLIGLGLVGDKSPFSSELIIKEFDDLVERLNIDTFYDNDRYNLSVNGRMLEEIIEFPEGS
jgi:hypothetical protein